MQTVVTVEQIQNEKKKEKNSHLIKVGPYGDIELSQGQINRLIDILRDHTENTIEFREGKKKTNSRLSEDQNRKVKNHRLIRSGALIDLAEKKIEKRKKPKKSKMTDEERERMIKETAVTFDQIK